MVATGIGGIGLGVSVALLWGTGDTLASVALRRLGTFPATLVAQTSGLITLALVGVLASSQMSLLALTPTMVVLSILTGALLGLVSAWAYLGLYRGLEQGPIAIVSPVASAQGAITLLLAVVFLHDRLSPERLLLLLAVLLGLVLASTQIKRLAAEVRALGMWLPMGVRYGLLAMLCFGVLNFGLGAAATQAAGWFLVLFWARCFSILFLAISALTSGSRPREAEGRAMEGPSWMYGVAVLAGCVEMGGFLVYSITAQVASTSVAGVCGSLAPLLPLLFGILAYRERLASNQLVGIVLVITALVALPLAPLQERWLLVAIAVGGVVALVVIVVKQALRPRPSPVSTLLTGSVRTQSWTVPAEVDG